MLDNVDTASMESRLRAEIRSAKSGVDADCKRAELACYWARLGKKRRAKLILQALLDKNRSELAPARSAWIHLLDGLIDFSMVADCPSRHKVTRADSIARLGGFVDMHALTSAWLAHYAYLSADAVAMSSHLLVSLQLASASNHSAWCRSSLVVAQALHATGHSKAAKAWYEKARRHAVADGDQASLSALMHSRAWLDFNEARSANFFEVVTRPELEKNVFAASSALNYDTLVQAAAAPTSLGLLRAQLLTELNRHDEALEIFAAHFESGDAKAFDRLSPQFLADRAWCDFHVGNVSEASRHASRAVELLPTGGFADDLAFCHRRLSRVFACLGDAARVERHRLLAQEHWEQHLAYGERVAQAMKPLAAYLDDKP